MKFLSRENIFSVTIFGLSVFSYSYLNRYSQLSVKPKYHISKLFDIPIPKTVHLKLKDEDLKKRIIIVGDIHGCLEEFKILLQKCNYHSSDSSIILVGDLVNKGLNS